MNLATARRAIRFILFTAALLSGARLCQAGTYEYFPGSALHLGGTLNPSNLTTSFATCIQYNREYAVHRLGRDAGKTPNPPAPGQPRNVAAENELSIQQIKTRQHLYEFLNISVSASGHYGFFGASGSVNYENEETFDSDSFVFGVRGLTTFAEVGLVDAQLTADAKALANNPLAFYARCGHEWVTQESRGVLIAVVYTIKNVSQSQRSKLEAAVSGGFNSPALGVNVSAQMTKILQSAFASNFYSAKVHFIGGNGVSDFATTITQVDDPVAVLKSISDYMKTLTYDNSVPLKFTTGSLDQFLTQQNPEGMFDAYNRRIGDLYLGYEEYRSQRSKVWQFLHQDTQSVWEPTLDDQAWARLDALNGVIGKIEAKAQLCRKAADVATSLISTSPPARNGVAPSMQPKQRDFVRDFARGLNASLVKAEAPAAAATMAVLLKKDTGTKNESDCHNSDSDQQVKTGREALCECLSDQGIYVRSRFPISAVPHIAVVHDKTLAPYTLLYVSVTSASRLKSVALVDNSGQTVKALTGGYDPEQGPVWYGSVVFRDGAGAPPPADKLPYVVKVVDGFGRTYSKPVMPLD